MTTDHSEARADAKGPTILPEQGRAADLLRQARQAYRDVVADPKSFGPAAARIVEQARAVGAPEALVHALRAQAWFERSHLGNERARALLDDAARTARRHGLAGALSEVLVTRAAVNVELGRLLPAQRDLDTAGGLNHRQGGGELTFQQAVLFHNLGRLSQAGALYEQILRDVTAPLVLNTKSANNYAILLVQQGRLDAARRMVDRGCELATEAGPHLTAALASTRAWVSTQQGRLTRGMDEFAEAARLYSAAGLPLAEHYLEYVDALTDLRLLPEAYEVAGRAAEDFTANGVQLMAGESLLRVARLAGLLGDHDAALEAAQSARERFTAQRRTSWRARADVVAADVRIRMGEVDAATLGQACRAAAVLDRLGLATDAVDAHLTAGRIALTLDRRRTAVRNLTRAEELAARGPVLQRLKGHLAAALATADGDRLRHCRAGLRDLARHRAAFASLELRVRASGHGAELGRLGLRELIRHGTPTQVLGWMERTRAAALIGVEPVRDPAIDVELAELRAVQAELLQAQDADPARSATLLDRQRGIEQRIRRHTWSSESTARGSEHAAPTSTGELRRALDGRTLVEYEVLDGTVLAVLLDPRRTRVVTLAPLADIRREVEKLTFGLRRLSRRRRSTAAELAARASVEHALHELRRLLVTPLRVTGDEPLVVSPAGGLRRVPWSAVHTGPVFVVPAAAFWQRTTHPDPRTGRVLLVAGPGLPGALDEVARLRSLHNGPVVLTPPDSTIDAVMPALASTDLAHMACHGRLRADNPAFSSLHLQDGLLTLHELDLRRIAPHRMVLAACESAVGTAFEGNEVLGFVSALMARGTDGLVASIVVIPDAASVPLMLGLHRRMLAGDSMGEALFRARATMNPDEPHEFVNWCAFNAYGAA
jgi:tetratricopeptide (TPR) repeat protein